MFPGAGAQVYRNEVGEVLGWDYPSDPDPDDFYDRYYLDNDFDMEPDISAWTEEDEDFPRGTYIESDLHKGIAMVVTEAESYGELLHAHMVGDRTIFELWRDDVRKIDREEFCGECGSLGCCHDGLDRDL